MNEVITISAGLLGVLIGGGISLAISNSRNTHELQLNQKNRVLDKLEQAHKIISILENNFQTVKSQLSIKRSHDINLDGSSSNKRAELEELKMIIAFYAPALIDELNQLDEETITFGSYFGKVITKKDLSKKEEEEVFRYLEITTKNITIRSNKLQANIIKIVQQHIEPLA